MQVGEITYRIQDKWRHKVLTNTIFHDPMESNWSLIIPLLSQNFYLGAASCTLSCTFCWFNRQLWERRRLTSFDDTTAIKAQVYYWKLQWCVNQGFNSPSKPRHLPLLRSFSCHWVSYKGYRASLSIAYTVQSAKNSLCLDTHKLKRSFCKSLEGFSQLVTPLKIRGHPVLWSKMVSS